MFTFSNGKGGVLAYLIGVPSMALCRKVVGLWQRLQGLRKLDRLTIWKKKRFE